jgi:hypothetical protein
MLELEMPPLVEAAFFHVLQNVQISKVLQKNREILSLPPKLQPGGEDLVYFTAKVW